MVNSTANMRSFDTTVDLSIDLLDRMGTFNEEIMGRVAELEDKYFDPDMIWWPNPVLFNFNNTTKKVPDCFNSRIVNFCP